VGSTQPEGGWLGSLGDLGDLDPELGWDPPDLASPVTPSSSCYSACCFSHLLSSQYVERHFSREGTTQHSTVSAFGRGQRGEIEKLPLWSEM
jgi:hypothetical protein